MSHRNRPLPPIHVATIEEIMTDIRSGARTPLQGLMRLTVVTAKSQVFQWRSYSEAITEVMPMVQWNPEGEEVEILGVLPVIWKSPLDFYRWADERLGLAFSTATYLRKLVEESDPDARDRLIVNSEIAIQKEKGQQLAANPPPIGKLGDNQYSGGCDKNENITPSDRGTSAAYRVAKLKRDHPEIVQRLAAGEFKSVAAAERAAKGEPEPERMAPVYAHWDDPEAAATRIREKLGDEFAQALKNAL